MKPYKESKAEMGVIQLQLVEAKKIECTKALKEVKGLFKKLGFAAGILKDSLDEG